jgi:CheY-like chemotaxis protein
MSTPARPLVLVVDDYEDARELLSEYLECEGFRTLTAADGLQAVAVARERRPDVVLMDLAMPVMNGFDATARIRSDWRTAAAVIIALTAHSCPEILARALRDGCDQAFVKPCDLSTLNETIRSRLAARATVGQGARAG